MTDPAAALIEWIREQGGLVHLEVRTTAATRIVLASRDFENGARMLAVPRRLLLTREIAATNAAHIELVRAGVSPTDGQLGLALYLLSARREETPWATYVDALPASPPPLPFAYDRDTLALLDGSSIRSRIDASRALFREQFDGMRAAVSSLADCELGEFQWARAMVSSRAFSLLGTEALVPMGDMLDHRKPADVEWGYEHPTESFTMRATRDIAAGETVYESYGDKSNRKLLERYGFCVDDARFDDSVLQVPSAPDGSREFRVRASEAKEETDAVAALRRALGRDRARAEVIAACDRALAAFPSSVEHDEAMLAGTALAGSPWSCVRVRLGEKRVLRAVRERHA